MRPFSYARPRTPEEAVAVISKPGSATLAGGTELLNWMRLGIEAPDRVVDLQLLDDLREIVVQDDGSLRIGALARLAEVADNDAVGLTAPVLRSAILQAASPQLRNLATIGGNLLQRTRCPYFRSEDPVPCNRRDPGSGCAALDGAYDNVALFGWTESCVATHPADPPVALAVLDAVVVTTDADGERRIPVRDFYVLPADRVDFDTVLAPGELITAIEVPSPATRSAYVKVRERSSYEFALVSAAAAIETDGPTLARARLALGSVAMGPRRLDEAEDALAGLEPTSPAVGHALDETLARATPRRGNEWKVRLARNTMLRAIRDAASMHVDGPIP